MLPFQLTLQKKVQFANWRLNTCYNALNCIVLIVAFTLVLSNRPWLETNDFKEAIHIHKWVEGVQNKERLKHTWTQMSKAEVCSSPDRFDYWWDMTWHYTNFSCIHLCNLDVGEGDDGSEAGGEYGGDGNVPQLAASCLHESELTVNEGKHQELLVTTMQEAYSETSRNSQTRFGGYSAFFNPFIEGLSVAFSYQYTLEANKWFNEMKKLDVFFHDFFRKDLFPKDTASTYSSENELVTVIVDSDERPWKIVKPSKSIVISVPDLLMLAGHKDFLDEPQPWAGKNEMPGADNPRGPIGRISGATLKVIVLCEHDDYWIKEANLGDQIKGKDACRVKVKLEKSPWESTDIPNKASIGRASTHTLYRGLRVEFEAQGHNFYYTVSGLFLFLTSVVVLMKMPTVFMRFFVTKLLGRTSEVYDRTLNEKMDLAHDIGGMLMRLMSHSMSFQELEEKFYGQTFITKDQLKSQLHTVLSSRANKLGDAEEKFLDFGFQCVSTDLKEVRRNTPLGFMERVRRSNPLRLTRSLFTTAAQQLPGQATRAFKAGRMGVICADDNSGVVQRLLSDGQARAMGVKEGDRIVNIGTEPYSNDAQQSAERSGSGYEVTFEASGVDMDNFFSSCSSNEKFSIAKVIRLFEQRRLGRLERLFMPSTLGAYMQDTSAPQEAKAARSIRREHDLPVRRRKEKTEKIDGMLDAIGRLDRTIDSLSVSLFAKVENSHASSRVETAGPAEGADSDDAVQHVAIDIADCGKVHCAVCSTNDTRSTRSSSKCTAESADINHDGRPADAVDIQPACYGRASLKADTCVQDATTDVVAALRQVQVELERTAKAFKEDGLMEHERRGRERDASGQQLQGNTAWNEETQEGLAVSSGLGSADSCQQTRSSSCPARTKDLFKDSLRQEKLDWSARDWV